MADASDADVLVLTAGHVAGLVGNEKAHVRAEDLPAIIRDVRGALMETSAPAPSGEEAAPAKPSKREIAKSLTSEALISFMDGKPYKTLKRHLAGHGLDMASYRERFGLPFDYPSVAPGYSAHRSEMAKKLGLGGKGRNKTTDAAQPAPATAPARKGGRKAATAG